MAKRGEKNTIKNAKRDENAKTDEELREDGEGEREEMTSSHGIPLKVGISDSITRKLNKNDLNYIVLLSELGLAAVKEHKKEESLWGK